MKKCIYIFDSKAKKIFLTLEEGLQLRINDKLALYASTGEPLIFAKKLKEYKNLYRFRVGDYRIIFHPKDTEKLYILMIVKIGHRKDIYKGALYEDLD